MKHKLAITALVLGGLVQLATLGRAEEIDGSDVRRDLLERSERVGKLSLDEQLKLREAQTKAAEDPEVKEAMRLRNEAIAHFRETVRASMLKADPTIGPILQKIAPR